MEKRASGHPRPTGRPKTAGGKGAQDANDDRFLSERYNARARSHWNRFPPRAARYALSSQVHRRHLLALMAKLAADLQAHGAVERFFRWRELA